MNVNMILSDRKKCIRNIKQNNFNLELMFVNSHMIVQHAQPPPSAFGASIAA